MREREKNRILILWGQILIRLFLLSFFYLFSLSLSHTHTYIVCHFVGRDSLNPIILSLSLTFFSLSLYLTHTHTQTHTSSILANTHLNFFLSPSHTHTYIVCHLVEGDSLHLLLCLATEFLLLKTLYTEKDRGRRIFFKGSRKKVTFFL